MTAVLASRPPLTRGRRLLAPLATVGALTAATVALHVRDPHQHGTWGLCPFKALTGLSCPGCGGLRAVNDLTHGDVGAALSSNLVVMLMIPVAVVLLALWTADRWAGRTRQLPSRTVQPIVRAAVVALVVFTVVRNTGAGAWLAP